MTVTTFRVYDGYSFFKAGGAVFTLSDGNVGVLHEILTPDGYLYSWLDLETGIPDSDVYWSPGQWNPGYGGNVGGFDACVDSNDTLHVVVATGNDYTNPVRYLTASYNSGTRQFTKVLSETILTAYTNGAPAWASVRMALDSSGVPHVVFVDHVTQGTETYDNIYYTKRTGVDTWSTPLQIGTRTADTDDYRFPYISIRNNDYIEVMYYYASGGDVAYKSYTGTWSSESYYTETSVAQISGSVTLSDGTVYRYYIDGSYNIKENGTDTGFNNSSSAGCGWIQASYMNDTRYIFFIDTDGYFHYIYNSGSGWTDGGKPDGNVGTISIKAEWAYNFENQDNVINYAFVDSASHDTWFGQLAGPSSSSGSASLSPSSSESPSPSAGDIVEDVVIRYVLGSGSASLSPSASASASASASESISASASPSASASASLSPSASPSPSLAELDIVWGHDTDVEENNVRNFQGNWTGTGSVQYAGVVDTERLALEESQYMISEVVNSGEVWVLLEQNKYVAGDDVLIEYRHGASPAACEGASWNTYTGPFNSLGFFQARLTSTL